MVERRLLDQFGDPVAPEMIAQLRDEIAGPSAIQGRAPFEGHLAFGINPERLGAVLRAADNGSSREWMILAEEIEELYPHYAAVLGKRKRQACQLPITVEPDNDHPDCVKHADFVREWLRTGVLQSALFDLCDGIGKGYSVAEIVWDTKPGAIRPAKLLWRRPSFFETSYQDGETLWLRTEQGFQDLAPHKFVVHRHPSKSGMALRGGTTRLVAFLWMFATYTQRDWAVFTQAYGLPLRLGKYGPEASPDDKRVLWRAVSNIAGDVAAIIPRSMEMEFVNAPNTGAGVHLFKDRADWMDRTVSKVVLGGTAGTDAINGGHAVGKEHREVEGDIERFDAGLLSATLTAQLVSQMVAFTFGPQPGYPKLLIGRPDEVPLAEVITAIADLGGLGLEVKESEVLGRLGLSKPEAGDRIIGGRPPTPEPKPSIPSPAVVPPQIETQTQRAWLAGLISRHSQTGGGVPEHAVDLLSQRLAEDAAGALSGMTERVRAVFDKATDLDDLKERLSALNLPRKAYGEAMQRAMALAHLVGQASLLDELRRR